MKGFSLIETLVVVALFAVVGAIIAQSTAIGLRGTRKSDETVKVRENLSQAMGVIERQLRSSRGIIDPTLSACNGLPLTPVSNPIIHYTDEDGINTEIGCNPNATCTAASNSYVWLGSSASPLTSKDTLCITTCQFVCTTPNNSPPTIDVVLEGTSKAAVGVEGAKVQLKTSVNLRAY